MNGIYNFEEYSPPIVTEQMLLRSLADKKRQKTVFIAAFLSNLIIVVLLAFAIVLYRYAPLLGVVGFATVIILELCMLLVAIHRNDKKGEKKCLTRVSQIC